MSARTFDGSTYLIAMVTTVCALLAPTSAAAEMPAVDEAPAIEATGQKDAAVIVGIEDYAYLPDIPGVGETVSDWETFLQEGRGVPSSRVWTLTDARAVREKILETAARARKSVKSDGRLWFVFVGHGAPSKDGQDGLLVGADAQSTPSVLQSRSVRRSEILGNLEGGGQAETVVMLDACFSGRARGDSALAEGTMPTVPTKLADKRQSESTVVVTAASANQFAGALPTPDRPAFSYMMLGAMRGWADDGDGKVTVSEAVDWTTRQMRHLSHDQTPTLLGSGETVLASGVPGDTVDLAEAIRRAVRSQKSEKGDASKGGEGFGRVEGLADDDTDEPSESLPRYRLTTYGSWYLRDTDESSTYSGAEMYRHLGKEELATEYEQARANGRLQRWIGLGAAGVGAAGAGVGGFLWNRAAEDTYDYPECEQYDLEPVENNCRVQKREENLPKPIVEARVLTFSSIGVAVLGGFATLVASTGNRHPVGAGRLRQIVEKKNEETEQNDEDGSSEESAGGDDSGDGKGLKGAGSPTSQRVPGDLGPRFDVALVPGVGSVGAQLRMRW